MLLLLFPSATDDVTGATAVTLANTTAAAAGASGAAGTTAVTLANLTSSASGTSAQTGALAAALGNATLAATGASGTSGTVALNLADTTSAAAGATGATGATSTTLDDVTNAAAGSVSGTVIGDVPASLDDVTTIATGTVTTLIPPDPGPTKCTIRRQKIGRRLVYNRHAERPAIAAWAINTAGELTDFSDPSYTFMFRIGNPGTTALLTKTSNISGATGSGSQQAGTPNVSIRWEPGDLDIEPGTYDCQLIATSTNLDAIYHGTIRILDPIL